jgi:hypothetical protein
VASAKAQQILREDFSFKVTNQIVLDWIEHNSCKAPDYQKGIEYTLQSINHVVAEPMNESWYAVLQPVWSKLIYTLSVSPMRFLVPALRKVSASVKHRQKGGFGVKYDIKIVDKMIADETYTIPVKLTNTGRRIWLNDMDSVTPVNISYHWYYDDNSVCVQDGIRTPLPRNISMGETVEMDMVVKAPDVAGNLRLEITLIQEHVSWFTDLGLEPFRRTVTIGEGRN